MSKQIIDGVSAYVNVPDGGKGLDIGCGSGALTIACAKRNPKASFTGIDRWGKEYAPFSKNLCESNSKAEGVGNTSFITPISARTEANSPAVRGREYPSPGHSLRMHR